MKLKVLVTPLTQGAYFAEHLDVAREEIRMMTGAHDAELALERFGNLDFLTLELPDEKLPRLARGSCVQGVFKDTGGALEPLALEDGYLLHEEMVSGHKYRGKTNELVTQLGINAALAFCKRKKKPTTLLDPMAGRGTTLLWAMRYGLNSRGIEIDATALDDIHRHIKRQTKVHRVKHAHTSGFVGKKNTSNKGKFQRYEFEGRYLQLIAGDSSKAPELLGEQRFDLLVTDLPYGVQHHGEHRRNPVETVAACAPAWVESMREGGAMVLIFNTYQPSRDALVEIFSDLGCTPEAFSVPHRMSESIVRDLVVFTR
jgi:hypothetical protein